MKIFAVYLLAVNLAGIVLTVMDKAAARRGRWRVPERRLFLVCALGACPGVYLTMRMIRHKTLHKRFMWGIPAIFVVQLAAVGAVCRLMPGVTLPF